VVRAGKKRTVIVDEHFIEDYVREPNQDEIPGYQPLMPKVEMSDAELKAVIEFIKGLK
jgi:cytochrome c oxidase subunit 2